MLYAALATDYDGTLATDGRVAAETLEALARLKAAGKRLILITGRELPELKRVFPGLHCFDLIVAENGGLLYFPKEREERPLSPPPPPEFVAELRSRKISPLSVGCSIVATWTPNETTLLEVIRRQGLDWQLTFNKGAVMCLPPGINKASGLEAALRELGLSPHNVVGIGDAENDQAFLSVCGCSVAVANALEPVRRAADWVMTAARGAGVVELIDLWLNDVGPPFRDLRRHDVYLGDAVDDGIAVELPAAAGAILILGSSGAGKSRLTQLLVERLVGDRYQVCILDPEGDYAKLQQFAHLGDTARTPPPEEVLGVLSNPGANVVVNLLGTEVAARPLYFSRLLGQLIALRAATGRPHWMIFDEMHHLSPRTEDHTNIAVDLSSVIFVTTRPGGLSGLALKAIGTVVGVGETAPQAVGEVCDLLGAPRPPLPAPPADAEVLYWHRGQTVIRTVGVAEAKHLHRRHTRKYVEGRLGEDLSFYFRGVDHQLNLRAYNLTQFLELAQGVDDATWLLHLRHGDYTRWFRDAIKDEALADECAAAQTSQDPVASRAFIAEAIKRRYVMSAD